MAKNHGIPGLKTSSGVLPKLIGTAIAIALLALVVKYPADAATWAKNLAGMAGDVIDGLVSFFRQIGN
ncbi:hypothetical protein [Amycolatopsis plumensis]|uniref:Uncharacterized protein n=1 Tax=Amycolatopsis plumensis TaxID=236508 RepID=A0ABV5UFB9_9PSEU